jgi:hypothetical protein
MNRIKALLLAGWFLLGMVNAMAQAQPTVRIRGVIVEVDGHELQVKTREGKKLKVNIADARIKVLSPLRISDIKQGSFVGVTAIRRGTVLRALEVHLFPEAQRGTGEGHYGWDLEPGSTMTNANVDAIVNTSNGKELTLSYRGGSQKIVVPQGTPIVSFISADKSLLKAGVQVFIIAHQAADGSLTAQRIMAGKDGMKPPM